MTDAHTAQPSSEHDQEPSSRRLTLAFDVVFIDGENISRLDIASLAGRFNGAEKLLYQSECAARKKGYPGFEHVIVPHVGKESVDKVIGMDIVDHWHRGSKRVCIVSNDRDYGATAIHLKYRYPGMHITLLCDPAKVSRQYIEELRRQHIRVEPISEDPDMDRFACQVLETIYHLGRSGKLDLTELGIELRARGVEYKKLKKELIKHNVAKNTPCDPSDNHVELSEAAEEAIRRLHARVSSLGDDRNASGIAPENGEAPEVESNRPKLSPRHP